MLDPTQIINDPSVITHVPLKITGGMDIIPVKWKDGNPHETEYRKIMLQMDVEMADASEVDSKLNEVATPLPKDGKFSIDFSSIDDFTRFANGLDHKAPENVLIEVSALDDDSFDENEDADVILNTLYLEQSELAFILLTKTEEYVSSAHTTDINLMNSFNELIYKWNSLFQLGLAD